MREWSTLLPDLEVMFLRLGVDVEIFWSSCLVLDSFVSVWNLPATCLTDVADRPATKCLLV